MRALLLCGILVSASLRDVSGQFPEDLDTTISLAVNTSLLAAPPALDTLRKLVNAGNYQAMGFDALADTAAATLGHPPLVIFLVALADLRRFRPGDNPWSILRASGKVLYPILVGGKPRSSVILARERNHWRGASYGGSNGAVLSSKAISAAERMLPAAKRRYFWVDVLAPRTGFIGFEQTKTLILIPLVDDQRNRWRAGVPIPAQVVFEHLAPEARRYNAMPR